MNESPKKILVVDDEPDTVTFLAAFLQDNGFEVTSAYDGKQCVIKAKEEQPDLITLDITMPEESGVRAFRNIRETEETRDIPVIIITGVAKDFKKFIHTRKHIQPPAAYMEKPIDQSELLVKINKILGV
ncbi:MAG TPA: response regulator [Desulfobacterales bacterium]|nr:response regulator [Desulfobacterales bacterium]